MATLKELQNQIGVTDFSLKAVFDKNGNTTNYLSYINEEKRIIVVVQKNIAIELTKDSNLNLQWETKIKTIDSKDYIVYEAIKEREPATTQGVKLKKNTKKIIIGSTIAVIAILILFFDIVWEQKKSQVTITMQEKNGVFYVPCKINSVEKEFLFDTGATDIMISLWDVMDIIRKGYMNENDFSGDTYTQIANGGIMKGTKIILKTV